MEKLYLMKFFKNTKEMQRFKMKENKESRVLITHIRVLNHHTKLHLMHLQTKQPQPIFLEACLSLKLLNLLKNRRVRTLVK